MFLFKVLLSVIYSVIICTYFYFPRRHKPHMCLLDLDGNRVLVKFMTVSTKSLKYLIHPISLLLNIGIVPSTSNECQLVPYKETFNITMTIRDDKNIYYNFSPPRE